MPESENDGTQCQSIIKKNNLQTKKNLQNTQRCFLLGLEKTIMDKEIHYFTLNNCIAK